MDKYLFKELPITPQIGEALIVKLFKGKILDRRTIVENVISYHSSMGGLESKNLTGKVKKALANLKLKGLAKNPVTGYWEIGEVLNDIESDSNYLDESEPIFQFIENENLLEKNTVEHLIGKGNGSVYLYYLETYREKAILTNQKFWQCKIGKTEGNAMERILSQAATALPEFPTISILFKTDFPSKLELVIHSILKLRGRNIDNIPGSEWFLTSPEEVKDIYNFIHQKGNYLSNI